MAPDKCTQRAGDGGPEGDRDSGNGIDIEIDDDVSMSTSSVEEGEIRSTPPSSVHPSTSSRSAFKPYISVLDTITSPETSSKPARSISKRLKRSSASSPIADRPSKRFPPWRNALGRAYLALDPVCAASGSTSNDQISPDEEDAYIALLQRAYANFSDTPVGSDVPVDEDDDLLDVIVDSEPRRFVFPGETITSYDTVAAASSTTPRHKGRPGAVQM